MYLKLLLEESIKSSPSSFSKSPHLIIENPRFCGPRNLGLSFFIFCMIKNNSLSRSSSLKSSSMTFETQGVKMALDPANFIVNDFDRGDNHLHSPRVVRIYFTGGLSHIKYGGLEVAGIPGTMLL